MKKILIVHTGGTIGSVPEHDRREVNVAAAKKLLFENFALSASPYAAMADELFEDVKFPYETLSENMTVYKWNKLLAHLNNFDLSSYSGVILLHGTDTLAYTAALLSLYYAASTVPFMLVAGDRPPSDERSNANANFEAAVALVAEGIAPNVYVPYRNADGKMHLHIGSVLLPCHSFHADFSAADDEKTFLLTEETKKSIMSACVRISQKRREISSLPKEISADGLLALMPYVGLDYGAVSLDGVRAVLHETYHSGTVCVERSLKEEDQSYDAFSFLTLADRLREKALPIFLSSCVYDGDKYSSTADAVENGSAVPLAMTFPFAYVKLSLALSLGYEGDVLASFMKEDVSGETVGQ